MPWLASRRDYRCAAGQYLYGFSATVRGGDPTKQCLPCPPGWAGLNGVYCERCGALQEPYYADRSVCVCRAPAVMNASGGCQCPDGYGIVAGEGGACAPCGRDTYGLGGACLPCGAGRTTGGSGATACEACAAGLYRPAGSSHTGAGCMNCSTPGWFAPDPTQSVCVECNRTCAAMAGWRWSRFCPGGGGNFSVCEPCPGGLPSNASWSNLTVDPVRRHKALEECAYSCHPGFYYYYNIQGDGQGGCAACNASRVCDPGWRLTPCSDWADSHCDVPCDEEQKPRLYSHWVPGSNECAWACDQGRTLVVTDYVIFTLRECV